MLAKPFPIDDICSYIIIHMHVIIMPVKCYVYSLLTWLSKAFDSINDIHTIALPRDNEMQLVKRLGPYNDRVAPGRQWQPLSGADVMV